jgi:type 1 glutamine amidotransferase
MEEQPMVSDITPLKVAVITGWHPYHVPRFHQFLRGLTHLDCYVQNLEDYVYNQDDFSSYDALVFYNFHQATPTGQDKGWEQGIKDALQRLGKSNQGIAVLHHALLAFPNWSFWAELVGIANRKFDYFHGQQVLTQIVDAEHPVTRGLNNWEMTDETYLMDSAGSDSHVLLTTQHPKSMRTLAWTRQFGQARVFCYEGLLPMFVSKR